MNPFYLMDKTEAKCLTDLTEVWRERGRQEGGFNFVIYSQCAAASTPAGAEEKQ